VDSTAPTGPSAFRTHREILGSAMRPLRTEFQESPDHVTSCGNERRLTSRSNHDRRTFLIAELLRHVLLNPVRSVASRPACG
jgi:hypothetical protein